MFCLSILILCKIAILNNFFGADTNTGLLLIANSLIFGILLFYVLRFALSHLTYSKIDSPYQFIFKCIIFIACMNSSFWICEKIINFIALLSDSICELGTFITGQNINFSNLISQIHSTLYPTSKPFYIFSFDGTVKVRRENLKSRIMRITHFRT